MKTPDCPQCTAPMIQIGAKKLIQIGVKKYEKGNLRRWRCEICGIEHSTQSDAKINSEKNSDEKRADKILEKRRNRQ